MLLTVGTRSVRDIYLKNLETGELNKLAEGGRPLYSSTGHILYQTAPLSGGLWALPFTLETLEATGEAFPVAEEVGDPSLAEDGTLVAVDVIRGGLRQLIWRDRLGNKVGEIGQPQASIQTPTLSPEGRHVAVEGREGIAELGDIWLHEVARAVKQRLTFDVVRDAFPAWSASGETIVFNSIRQGAGDLFERAADGGGEARTIVESPAVAEWQSDWLPDGRHLVYEVISQETGYDLALLARETDRADGNTRPFLATPFSEVSPQISPNGRLVAYCSDESGSREVYVREFPEGGGRWQVSERGGCQPRWSHDGRELFYVEGDTLMAVKVNLSPSFSVGEGQLLFQDPTLSGANWDYDVAADGSFVMVEDVVAEGESRRKAAIRITENWYEEFRDRE